jgi:hypothetical protein
MSELSPERRALIKIANIEYEALQTYTDQAYSNAEYLDMARGAAVALEKISNVIMDLDPDIYDEELEDE